MKRQSSVMATPQCGAVLPMVIVSLVVLIGMSGLALDLGHAYVNKTRLQNAVDAAALSGAKTLDITSDTAQATTAARNTFDLMVGENGNQELNAELSGSDLTVEFSNTLFSAGTTPARYIRVRNNSFTRPTWLVRVFNLLPGVDFSTITVGASAVAGPSPVLARVCNVAPIIVCGTPGAPPNYGYTPGENVVVLKQGEKAGGEWEIAPGNFHLLQLTNCDSNSAICVADNLAGKFDACLNLNDPAITTPGNKASVGTGLNTRFGIYESPHFKPSDSVEYPPDWVTDAGGAGYPDTLASYQADYASGSWDHYADGRAERRVLALPIGDCNAIAGSGGGSVNVPVLTIGCFLLDRPADTPGNAKNCGDPNKQEFCGRFIGTEGCNAQGVPGPDPGTGPGPHTIQLYKDPASPDA